MRELEPGDPGCHCSQSDRGNGSWEKDWGPQINPLLAACQPQATSWIALAQWVDSSVACIALHCAPANTV